MTPMGGHRQTQVRARHIHERCPYIEVGPGRSERAIKPEQDLKGTYQDACFEFADSFGWDRGRICFEWSQIAYARMWAGDSKDYAEEMAMANVREVFDQRGREPC